MLELTHGGRACSVEKALEFLEIYLPDCIPKEIQDEEFCSTYEEVLNRYRWLAKRITPVKPKLHKGETYKVRDHYTCGACGEIIRGNIWDDFCGNCGRKILWDDTRCLTGYNET